MDDARAEMPFLDHLEELRRRLIWSLVAVGVASAVGFFLVTELDVIGILARPIRSLIPGEQLLFTSPTTPVVVTFKLAFLVGLVLALPIVAYQAWAFLAPALLEEERRYVVPALWLGMVLFLAGIAMAYFLVLPLGLRFLLSFQAGSLEPIITVDEYLRFAARLILAFGLIFEIPVVLVVLGLAGVVTPDTLRRYRRHAVILVSVMAAVLTPADVGTMLMMMAPMVLLYELSILLLAAVLRRTSREAARSGGTAA